MLTKLSDNAKDVLQIKGGSTSSNTEGQSKGKYDHITLASFPRGLGTRLHITFEGI